MKLFRQIALSAMITLSAFAAVVYSSCSKDACSGVTCSNGGTCSGGNCTCTSGWGGKHCDTADAYKFVGTYSVRETCSVSGSVGPYTATVTQSTTNQVNILLQNFGDFSATITVAGSVTGTTLTIAQQTITGYTISGSGTYNGGVITITYTVSGSNNESCTATWTKQ